MQVAAICNFSSYNNIVIHHSCAMLHVSLVQNKAAMSVPDDIILGHMLVLMQFDWPVYERLFCETVQLIKRKGHFFYPMFFGYIISILKLSLLLNMLWTRFRYTRGEWGEYLVHRASAFAII